MNYGNKHLAMSGFSVKSARISVKMVMGNMQIIIIFAA